METLAIVPHTISTTMYGLPHCLSLALFSWRCFLPNCLPHALYKLVHCLSDYSEEGRNVNLLNLPNKTMIFLNDELAILSNEVSFSTHQCIKVLPGVHQPVDLRWRSTRGGWAGWTTPPGGRCWHLSGSLPFLPLGNILHVIDRPLEPLGQAVHKGVYVGWGLAVQLSSTASRHNTPQSGRAWGGLWNRTEPMVQEAGKSSIWASSFYIRWAEED